MRTGSAMSVSRSSQAPSSAACSLLLTLLSLWQGTRPSRSRLPDRPDRPDRLTVVLLRQAARRPVVRQLAAVVRQLAAVVRQLAAAATASPTQTFILTRQGLTGTSMPAAPRPHRSCRMTSMSGVRLTQMLLSSQLILLCSMTLTATK